MGGKCRDEREVKEGRKRAERQRAFNKRSREWREGRASASRRRGGARPTLGGGVGREGRDEGMGTGGKGGREGGGKRVVCYTRGGESVLSYTECVGAWYTIGKREREERRGQCARGRARERNGRGREERDKMRMRPYL